MVDLCEKSRRRSSLGPFHSDVAKHFVDIPTMSQPWEAWLNASTKSAGLTVDVPEEA